MEGYIRKVKKHLLVTFFILLSIRFIAFISFPYLGNIRKFY